MSDPIYFAPLRVPFVDPETGIISRPWQLLLQGIFNRVGGANGLSISDVLILLDSATQAASQGPPIVPGIALDDQAPPILAQPTSNDVLAELYQARDQVAELQKRIQDLQQGPVCL